MTFRSSRYGRLACSMRLQAAVRDTASRANPPDTPHWTKRTRRKNRCFRRISSRRRSSANQPPQPRRQEPRSVCASRQGHPHLPAPPRCSVPCWQNRWPHCVRQPDGTPRPTADSPHRPPGILQQRCPKTAEPALRRRTNGRLLRSRWS